MWAREQGGALFLPTAVNVSVPFHAAGVQFVGDLLGPPVGSLAAFDPAVAVAPSYFDLDLWSGVSSNAAQIRAKRVINYDDCGIHGRRCDGET